MTHTEPTRHPDPQAHVWKVPAGLTAEQARNFFHAHVKPSTYTYEHFRYVAASGQVYTV
jgi:hypothetical protein